MVKGDASPAVANFILPERRKSWYCCTLYASCFISVSSLLGIRLVIFTFWEREINQMTLEMELRGEKNESKEVKRKMQTLRKEWNGEDAKSDAEQRDTEKPEWLINFGRTFAGNDQTEIKARKASFRSWSTWRGLHSFTIVKRTISIFSILLRTFSTFTFTCSIRYVSN